jgi:hypothetical protein
VGVCLGEIKYKLELKSKFSVLKRAMNYLFYLLCQAALGMPASFLKITLP